MPKHCPHGILTGQCHTCNAAEESAREYAVRHRAKPREPSDAELRLFDILLDDDGQAWKEARKYLERAVPELYAELERRESLRGNSPSAAQEGVPSDAMVDAYLQAQRRAVEDADQFGRPNIGGLHSNTVREACRAGLKAALAAAPKPTPSPAPAQPLDMVLHCPACGMQHIDAPDDRTPHWKNEPHRSHLCHGCGHIWRPADVATNGVSEIKTKGTADRPIVQMQAVAQIVEQLENTGDGLFARIQWIFNPVPVGEVLYWPQEKYL